MNIVKRFQTKDRSTREGYGSQSLSLLFVLCVLLTACSQAPYSWNGTQNSISGMVVPLSPVASAGGSSVGRRVSASSAATCPSAVASLYHLDRSGERVQPALQTVPVSSDGQYAFTQLRRQGVSVKKINQLTEPYLVEITGCNRAYARILTATDKQDINWASTLVSYVVGTPSAQSAVVAKPAALDKMYSSIESGDFGATYAKLTGDPALRAEFQNLFGTLPVALEDASPMLVTVNVPNAMKEGETSALSLTAVQWKAAYTHAYRWEIDGQLFSNANSVNFVPHGNQQGPHEITVKWGQDDGQGDVDLTKPHRSRKFSVNVSDDIAAMAPPFSIEPAFVNTKDLTLRLQTGPSRAACASFTRMAITEDLPLAPLNPADYTISCSAAPTQDLAYRLQGGVGAHSLYLWAIDSSGNISPVPRTEIVRYSNAVPTVDILSPAPAAPPFASGFTISGVCDQDSGDVRLSGDIVPSPLLTSCTGGTFSRAIALSAGDGPKTITAAQTNVFGSSASDVITVSRDSTAPTVSLSSLAPTNTNTASFLVTVAFSESVTGFDATKPFVTNGTISGFTGSGANYSFTVTAAAQGPVAVSVPAGAAADSAGNANLASASLSRNYDSIAPTVVLATSALEPTRISPLAFTATFSEPVTGFGAGLITVTNGTVAGFAGSGAAYSFQVNPTGQGLVTVRINAGAGQDPAANASAVSNLVSRTYDNVRPGVTLSSLAPDPTNVSPIVISAAFTEPVLGFAASSLTLVNATATNFVGTGANYTFDLVPGAQGSVSVTVNANSAQDPAGNQNTASTSLTRNFDSTAPTVVLATTAAAYTNVSPIPFTVTFSKSVTGFDGSDLTVTNGVASAVAGSAGSYNFTVTPSGQGVVSVRVVANAAVDSATNPSSPSNLVSLTYDTVAPTLSIASPSAGAYVNSVNRAAFAASGACSENGRNVQLTVGSVSASAPCTSGAYATSLDLSALADGPYSLTAALSDLAGNSAPVQSVALTKDVAAPTATLAGTPNSPSNATAVAATVAGTDVSHYRVKFGASAVTDCSVAAGYAAEATVATALTGSLSAIADGNVTLCVVGRDVAGNYQPFAAATTHTWLKDSAITPFSGLALNPASPGKSTTPTLSGTTEGNASLTLFRAAACGAPAIATGTAAAGGSFSLVPGSALGADGAYTLSVRATDAAGNTVCSASVPYLLDTVAPTVTLASTAASFTRFSPIPVTATFSENVTGFSAAGITVVNGTAGSFSGSGSTYTFSVTPTGQGLVTISVPAASARDTALNDNVASASLLRTYDSVAPALTIASPAVGAGTNQNHLVFSGACEDGISIVIGGSGAASPASATCSAGAYSVDINFTAGEGTKNISLSQTDVAGNVTTQSRFITFDTIPPSISFTSVAVQNQITNTNTVTFGGACESGINVVIAGGVDTGSVPCAGSLWSYTTASRNTDITRNYTFTQTDAGGNSASISGSWLRDTVAPALTRVSPADGTSAKDSVVVTGACETGLTVSFSGAGILAPLNPTCAGGTYSQSVFFSAGDGAKPIVISQTDVAGNNTTINANFVRDNVAPAITQTLRASPYWTNTDAASFGGACENGLTISVTRDGSAEGTTTCTGSAWTYTVATQTTDATRTYTFSQTDSATNTGTVSAQWVRRTTNPTFSFTSATTFNTSSNSVTYYGNCMNGVAIQVTGADTTSTTCSGGAWTYTVAAQSSDATRTYNFRQTDPAGNFTALVGTWTRNTALPQLTLANTTPYVSNGSSLTLSGGCSNGLAINVTGAVTTSLTCSSGAWSYTANQASDGAYTYTLNQTDTFGNSTTVTMNWRRDTVAPTISSLSLNGGASVTSTSYARAAMNASDGSTNVQKFCLKTNNTAPALNEGCWTAVNANPPGLTPAPTLALSNFNFYLGITPATYTVYAWVQDAAGNISTNTNVSGVDRATIDYQIIYPPVLDSVFATNTNAPSYPVPSPQLSVGAGNFVYIKWRATSGTSLGATPIRLTFTTDDSTWNAIGDVANTAGSGCTLNTSAADSNTTGCYRWSAPTSTFMRIRIEVIDSGGRTTAASPPPLNTGTFRVIAGNTEPGINASSLASVYRFRKQIATSWTEPNAFAISSAGIAYVNDHVAGILKIDPADGLTRVLIPKTGVTSGNGSLSSATVRSVYGIALDYEDRLLVWDSNQIRRVDFNSNTITRIIGGGAQTGENITSALNLAFEGYTPLPVDRDSEYDWRTIRVAMIPMPNGDLYFGSWLSPWVEAQYKFRRYQESSGTQITTVKPTGYGHSGGTTVDISKCFMGSMGFSFNPANSAISAISIAVADHGDSSTTYCRGDGTRGPARSHSRYEVVLDDTWTTKAVQPPQGEVAGAWAFYQRITGRNGTMYAIRRQTARIYKFDPATTAWTQIAGSGNVGSCADGTAALSCDMDIQDMFVSAQGQLFFLDGARIRTLDSSNRLVTLFGQGLSSGDGGDPLLARISQLWSFAVGSDKRVVFYDDRFLREVAGDGSLVSRIAGNGRIDWGRVGNTALTTPFRNGADWVKTTFFLDPANHDVIMPVMESTGRGAIGRLQRSTGTWVKIFGAGTTPYYSAEGLTGDQISLGMYEDQTNAWADGFQLLHYSSGGKILLSGSGYPNLGTWKHTMLKTYDGADSWRQLPILGMTGPMSSHSELCGDTTASDACSSGLYHRINKVHYDADGKRWILAHNHEEASATSTRIRWIADNENNGATRTMQTLVTLPRVFYNFAYWKTGGHEYVYYCGNNGNLYRYDVTSASEVQLTLPSSAMKCTGGATLELDRATSTLYFGFKRNGLAAIGSINAI